MPSSVARSQAKQALQTRQRVWLEEIMQVTGKKASQIADGAGVSDTTLTRLLYNPDYSGTLSQVTIERIKTAYRLPGPEEIKKAKGDALFGFSEAERFNADKEELPGLTGVVEAISKLHNDAEPWRLKTSSLEVVGYLAGDLVFVDVTAIANPQDAVCAQIADYQRGSAETVWRVFDPPFLVGAAHDRTAYKPVLVDNERVKVRGVIVESLRPHRLSQAR